VSNGAELVDSFEKLVAAHAKLPVGSAAAATADERVVGARFKLLFRMQEDASEIARLRSALSELRDYASDLAMSLNDI
jgi:hypothetical protein